MIKNYLKIAWRNLIKNRASSLINICGLAVGMAVAMLIGLWIWDELSFNKYHQNYDSIAEVKANANYSGVVYTVDSQPMPLANELGNSYDRDFKYIVMSTATEQHVLLRGDKKFAQSGRFMQADAPDMLTLKMLNGSRNGLKEHNSILISASLAQKLFGNASPAGKLVKVDNQFTVKVTGVYEDLPQNSDFNNVTFIAPFDFYLSCYDWAQKKYTNWGDLTVNIYTQLKPGVNFGQASAHIKNVLASRATGNLAQRKPQLFLQPMSKWHLYSRFENGVNITSNQLQFVWFYGIVGAFVLILACINFMNLSTARSEKRAKEVGIRKAIGSIRSQLVKQFYCESLLVAVLAFLFALALVQLSLPWFNGIAGKNLVILFNHPAFWVAGIAFTAFTGLIAGSYPALYLSSFNPVKVLKGTFRANRFAALPRKALIVLQFTFSITLIIGTIVVYRQIQVARNRPIGYTQQGLLQVKVNSPEFQNNLNVFKNKLINAGLVSDAAVSASPVTSIWSTNTGFTWAGNENTKQVEFATINVSKEYGRTVGWQFVDGRDFSKDPGSDSTGLVINEAAAALTGLKHPIGETVVWDQVKGRRFKILGVVKNMVMESPYQLASPTLFFIYNRDGVNFMFLKLVPNVSAGNAVTKISEIFKKVNPSTVFEYSFADDEFNKKFSAEERVGALAGAFAALAIFISCLGLFGMALFVAARRIKEIGVRKVLGATVFNLWYLLSTDFVVLTIIALFIASPLSYFFMHKWLQGYAYRVDINWWIFAATALGAMFITLITVSYQSIKAALANPVKSLKTE